MDYSSILSLRTHSPCDSGKVGEALDIFQQQYLLWEEIVRTRKHLWCTKGIDLDYLQPFKVHAYMRIGTIVVLSGPHRARKRWCPYREVDGFPTVETVAEAAVVRLREGDHELPRMLL